MEYYLAIKGNVLESVLVRWMNLEPVTQSEVRKRKTSNILTHTHGRYKNGTDESIYRAGIETEMESRLVDTESTRRRRGWDDLKE